MSKAKESADLKPVNRKNVTVRLVGISPLIQHKWAEKAKEMMREKQQTGKKTKDRQLRDPEQEGKDAMYVTTDGKPGILAVAIKASCISAAHKDLGIEKTLVKKALFIKPAGREVVIPLEMADGKGQIKYEIVEDMVRVGQGSADLRYRPYFYDWAVTTEWEIDADLLQTKDLLTLLDRAGFGVGLCEWRPSSKNGGEYGRFKVDENFPVKES